MKRYKLFFIFYFFLFVSANVAFAQSDDANHQKYWYYKSRFNNDFIKVGLDSGESIPFTIRGRWAKSFDIENVELYTGDATSHLGNYIALLATELYLLKISEQNISEVKHELFCALNTINRLDAHGENIWQQGAGTLNGFFIRDDIPRYFLKKPENFTHFNYYDKGIANHELSRGFLSKMNCGANFIYSDLIQHEDFPTHDISMSQDQVYNLLFGLMFVVKFVDEEETDGSNIFGYGSDETSLVKEARNIANRLIGFVKNSVDLDGNSCSEKSSPGWLIKNPTTCEPVKRGPNARIYAYALGEIQCMINHPSISTKNKSRGVPFACAPNNGYHNGYSSYTGYFLWNNNAKGQMYLGTDNPHYGVSTRQFNVLLASLCNCVYGSIDEVGLNSITRPLNNLRIVRTIGIGADWASMAGPFAPRSLIPGWMYNITSSSITKTAYINGNGSPSNPLGDPGAPFDHAPLVRKILHGGKYRPNNKYSFKYLLNVAPCDDIYNLNNLNYAHYEWSADNRLDQPDRRGWYGSNNKKPKNPFKPYRWRAPSGEYNGIDYMLYHNLWYIHEYQEGKEVETKNVSNIIVDNGNGIVSNNIKAFETIEVKNTIISNTDSAFWRAGKMIYLAPGTEITGSNNLRVYIERFECATDHGQYATTAPPKVWNFTQSIGTASPVYQTILKDEDLVITPSVTEDQIKIYFDAEPEERLFITIMDMQGNIISSIERLSVYDSGVKVDVSTWPSAMYIVRLIGTSGVHINKKFIKL